MAGSIEFIAAIVDKLRLDATLVSLTTHTTGDKRIAADMPLTAPKVPYLAVNEGTQFPLDSDVPTKFKRAEVDFIAITSANNKLVCQQILDRLEVLLHSSDNTSYWNISNASLRNLSTKFVSRDYPEYNKDANVWVGSVTVQFVWVGEPCG